MTALYNMVLTNIKHNINYYMLFSISLRFRIVPMNGSDNVTDLEPTGGVLSLVNQQVRCVDIGQYLLYLLLTVLTILNARGVLKIYPCYLPSY